MPDVSKKADLAVSTRAKEQVKKIEQRSARIRFVRFVTRIVWLSCRLPGLIPCPELVNHAAAGSPRDAGLE